MQNHFFLFLFLSETPVSFSQVTMFGYLTEMDYAVGKIVAKVDEIGATDNTVYIFSSDNGTICDFYCVLLKVI